VAAAIGTADSSVLVAGFLPKHPFHEQALAALPSVRSVGRLVAHTMAEAYSVLTSHPFSHPTANVLRYLDQFVDRPPIGLSPSAYPAAMQTLAEAEVTGSAIYDGLIAAAVREGELRLMSLDRRAARVYALFGIDYEILI
jgi:predicted nucleic acid-binding protein